MKTYNLYLFVTYFLSMAHISVSKPAPCNITFETNRISKFFYPSVPLKQTFVKVKVTSTTELPSPKCTITTQTEYKGKCFQVLQQFPCADGEWLVEDNEGKGRCIENKCSSKENQFYFEGKCVSLKSEEFCPKGMKTHIYRTGVVGCDCKEEFIYNTKDGNCYEAYRQGPCRQSQVFALKTISKGVTTPNCQKNPCMLDGYFCNSSNNLNCEARKNFYWALAKGIYPTRSTNCVKFGSACTLDGKGVFVIHPETNQPYCQTELHNPIVGNPTTRIIGNVPILKCAPGSKRDILGNCRTPTIIDFS